MFGPNGYEVIIQRKGDRFRDVFFKAPGWVKHADFIVLDILCLHAAFVLAYISRHGLDNPYADGLYLNLAMAYTAVDFMVLIMNSTMKNVLKRGFYKEILQTGKLVIDVNDRCGYHLN